MSHPLAWLRPGRDHQLAATKYPGRESATARAARLTPPPPDPQAMAQAANWIAGTPESARRRRAHHQHAPLADRAGATWSSRERWQA